MLADSMKARPSGEGVQLVAGRYSRFSDRETGSDYMLCGPGGAAALHIVF